MIPTDRSALHSALDSLADQVQQSGDDSLDKAGVLALVDDIRQILDQDDHPPSRIGKIDLLGAERQKQRIGRGWRASF